jgi:hypothetical protein
MNSQASFFNFSFTNYPDAYVYTFPLQQPISAPKAELTSNIHPGSPTVFRSDHLLHRIHAFRMSRSASEAPPATCHSPPQSCSAADMALLCSGIHVRRALLQEIGKEGQCRGPRNTGSPVRSAQKMKNMVEKKTGLAPFCSTEHV